MEPLILNRSSLSTKAHVNKYLARLAMLADKLLERQKIRHKHLIVPFIGAGASKGAGLPLSSELKQKIFEALIKWEGPSNRLVKVLNEEASFIFPDKAKEGIKQLSLFEFAAVLLRFEFARKRIHKVIRSTMEEPKRRPLVYELLAHLAKHQFIDHFVSVNFDELLDDALRDELPDRLSPITSRDDLPGLRSIKDKCYLFKPFGSISRDSYKLDLKDIQQYGSDSIWQFMLNTFFRLPTANDRPGIVLIVVGYAADEKAFEQLMTELLNSGRGVTIFLIDPCRDLPIGLKRFKSLITHIRLEADLAFDLLLKIMKIKYTANPYRVWIPVARHRIISALPYKVLKSHRFKVELILQTIKSRGFFTIEAIAEIGRIRRYSDDAYNIIQQMCTEKILSPRSSSHPEGSARHRHLRQDYILDDFDNHFLPAKLLEESPLSPHHKTIEWEVDIKDDKYVAERMEISYQNFFQKRFREIMRSPEIEISAEASPSTYWLFSDARKLTSISELTETTAKLLFKALEEAQGPIELYGVWTTGEWLFHEEGWAWEIGKKLIKRLEEGPDRLKMFLVLAKSPNGHTVRSEREKVVRERLNKFEKEGFCEIHPLNWWQQNRSLTLLCWQTATDENRKEGIYMRRRLATPLVAPVSASGEDCVVLRDIFERYRDLSIRNIERGRRAGA